MDKLGGINIWQIDKNHRAPVCQTSASWRSAISNQSSTSVAGALLDTASARRRRTNGARTRYILAHERVEQRRFFAYPVALPERRSSCAPRPRRAMALFRICPHPQLIGHLGLDDLLDRVQVTDGFRQASGSSHRRSAPLSAWRKLRAYRSRSSRETPTPSRAACHT